MDPDRWRDVSRLFAAAAALDGRERDAYLDEACDDAALRAAVDSMLAAHDNAGSFGNAPAIAASVQRKRLAPGNLIGVFRVETLLGAGGMGEVYRAHDTRLGRQVAIKVLPDSFAHDADRRSRFEQEARAASALNHPAIVTIYDIGESDGLSWIAMEYIEGRTLRTVVAHGPVPLQRAWSIARQLADGLAVAHAKGIVHRDLKPENVMVTDDGRVKILDFGLARRNVPQILDNVSSAATVTNVDVAGTMAGVILGTVGYMSPEQATGRTVDFRSDQFSFGAVIYEVLTGRRAFERPSAVESLSAIVRDEPPSVVSIRHDVSDAFQRVLSRCLEKLPEQRFESTRELATALESLTPESSIAAAPTGSAVGERYPTADATRPILRTRGVAIAAAVLLAAVASAPFLWNRSNSGEPPSITSVAVLPFENSAQDPDIEYLGDGLTDALIDRLSRAQSLKVMARATVLRFKGQDDPREAARALGVGAVVTGAVARRGNQIVISAELIHAVTGERLWGQTFDQPAADLMRVQDTIVASIADGLRLRLTGEEKARLAGAGTDNPEAYELLLKGKFLLQSDTEETDLEARKLFMQAVEKDPRFVDAHLAIASTYTRSAGGGYEPPRQALAQAREALEKAAAIAPNHVGVRVALTFQRLQLNRDWAVVEREFRALSQEPEIFRSIQYHPIAVFFVAIGRPDEAVALVERALLVDPGNLESRVMLGNFLLQAGRLDDALRAYNTIAAEVPDDPRPFFGIADVHKRRGDFVRAGEARRKAHELVGDETAARAFTGAATEAAYTKAEVAVARLHLRELEELAKRRYISPFDIARAHAEIGNREQALAGLEEAIEDDSFGLILLKVDQAWDSVRDDPRFAAIVRRVGIP